MKSPLRAEITTLVEPNISLTVNSTTGTPLCGAGTPAFGDTTFANRTPFAIT